MENNPFDGDFQSGEDRPISTVSTFRIKKNQINAVIEKANLGCTESSFNLYHHFRFSEKNLSEAEKWLIKAAQQGHVTSQHNVAVHFLIKNQLAEALYWAGLAKVNGSVSAAILVEKIELRLKANS